MCSGRGGGSMPRHALDSPPSSAAPPRWPGSAWPIVPAAASADSLVYVKSGNVWLSKPDGSGAYQVTTDGSTGSPYRSPSQADDGTIAAGHDDEIVRMTQNGTVLNRIDPPGLVNSVSHLMDGPPVDVAISPDGARIAYTLVSYECPVGASCGARSATAYTAAGHFTAPGPAARPTSATLVGHELAHGPVRRLRLAGQPPRRRQRERQALVRRQRLRRTLDGPG